MNDTSPLCLSDTRVEMEREAWMARKLHVSGSMQGLTTRPERMQSIRRAILDGNLSDVRVGYKRGKPMTWAQMFEATYHAPLAPTETLFPDMEVSR